LSLHDALPIFTFKNAQNLRDALAVTPRDRILVETDAPFLTPVPLRGRPNAPYLVPITVRFLAAELGVDLDELCAQVAANTRAVYGDFGVCLSDSAVDWAHVPDRGHRGIPELLRAAGCGRARRGGHHHPRRTPDRADQPGSSPNGTRSAPRPGRAAAGRCRARGRHRVGARDRRRRVDGSVARRLILDT